MGAGLLIVIVVLIGLGYAYKEGHLQPIIEVYFFTYGWSLGLL